MAGRLGGACVLPTAWLLEGPSIFWGASYALDRHPGESPLVMAVLSCAHPHTRLQRHRGRPRGVPGLWRSPPPSLAAPRFSRFWAIMVVFFSRTPPQRASLLDLEFPYTNAK